MAERRVAQLLRALRGPSTSHDSTTQIPKPSQASGTARHVLVVGATGVVGRAAVEHFEGLGSWRVTMVSRRPPLFATAAQHIPLDLTDRLACEAALGSLGGVTHLVYTALSGVDIAEPAAVVTNTEMLRNTLESLETGASAQTLQHVSLMQGRKAYAGADPKLLLWPLKERHPRSEAAEPNWYFTHEDLLIEHHQRQATAWTYTIWRPPTVLCDFPLI